MNIITGHAVVIPLSVWDVNSNTRHHDDIDTEAYIANMGYNLGRIGVKPTNVYFFNRSYMRRGDKEGTYLVVVFENKEDAFNFSMLYNAELD